MSRTAAVSHPLLFLTPCCFSSAAVSHTLLFLTPCCFSPAAVSHPLLFLTPCCFSPAAGCSRSCLTGTSSGSSNMLIWKILSTARPPTSTRPSIHSEAPTAVKTRSATMCYTLQCILHCGHSTLHCPCVLQYLLDSALLAAPYRGHTLHYRGPLCALLAALCTPQ